MTLPILPGVSIHLIQTLVAKRFKVPLESMTSLDRKWTVAHPRQLAMALSCEFTRHSKSMIGGRFGGRDHSTVWHSCWAVERRAARDLETAEHRAFMRAMLAQLTPRPVEIEEGVEAFERAEAR